MKQPSENLRKKIKRKRPDITESSLNVYITSLRMLYSQYVDGNEEKLSKPLKTKFLHDFAGIKKLLETCRTPNTVKTRLTSILVGLDAETKNRDQKLIDRYQAYLKDVMVNVNEGIESQEKTRKESKNWVTMDEVKDVVNKILTKINAKNLWKKENLSKSEFLLIQKYILLRFYIQYPWRNYVANTKVVTPSEYEALSDSEKNSANWLIRNGNKFKFMLNFYKNIKKLGKKQYDIDPSIAKLLVKFFKINKSGWMFTLANKTEPISANGVTKLLNSIFQEYTGKRVSTSMLRHVQVSDYREGEESIEEKKKKAKAIEDRFQHSQGMNDTYRRIEKD
jgi:hypothetical protein